MSKRWLVGGILLAVAVLFFKISIINRNGREGLFLLKGENGVWLVITDDLYHFEAPRLIWGMPFPKNKRTAVSTACTSSSKPCTMFEWNVDSGRGFIKTYYPDGKRLHINLGRFISPTTGKPVSGLFIGGDLPATDPDFNTYRNSETGMAYFDGERFYHIWCNVNEGIIDEAGNGLLPSTWIYLSSKILENSERQLTILSKHSVMVGNVPVYIERLMTYKTGDTFLTFKTMLKNSGNSPVTLRYMYGDEPWLGNYDTFSKGNVGWTREGLINTETKINTKNNNYVGMFDYGNPLADESHNFTKKANFLEWEPAKRPEIAYISNQFGSVTPGNKTPLTSYKTRVISLEWGPITLAPHQYYSFSLRVGMANNDPKTGFPVKPDTGRH